MMGIPGQSQRLRIFAEPSLTQYLLFLKADPLFFSRGFFLKSTIFLMGEGLRDPLAYASHSSLPLIYGKCYSFPLFPISFSFYSFSFYPFGMMVLGIFLYHSLLEGTWGKTIGKKICGIVDLKEDFTKCTIGRGFLRNLMRIVDNFFYYLVGVVAMAGTMRWQRLGDLVAGTVVIRDKRR